MRANILGLVRDQLRTFETLRYELRMMSQRLASLQRIDELDLVKSQLSDLVGTQIASSQKLLAEVIFYAQVLERAASRNPGATESIDGLGEEAAP
jgi:hypothetical protein